MQVKNALLGIIAVAGLSQIASATTYESVRNGDWSTGTTAWTSGVPGQNDFVRIKAGHTVTVTSAAAADHIEIESGGVLQVVSNATLQLDGSDSPTNVITGNLQLGNGSTQYGVLKIVSNDQTFQGTGYIQGRHDDSAIEIGDALTFNSRMLVRGIMIIQAESGGEATYANLRQSASTEGRVLADDAGGFVFADTVNVVDEKFGANRPSFEVRDVAGAYLQFDLAAAASSLEGNFIIAGNGNCVQMLFNNDVQTGGTLSLAYGCAVTSATGSFAWNGGAPNSPLGASDSECANSCTP